MDLVLVLLLLSLHSNTISHLDFSLAPRYDYTVFRKIIYIFLAVFGQIEIL